MARGLGVEPRLLEPESSVLPLDDPRIKITNHQTSLLLCKLRLASKYQIIKLTIARKL